MNSSLYEPRLLCLFITNKLKSQHTRKYEIQLTSSDKKVLVDIYWGTYIIYILSTAYIFK